MEKLFTLLELQRRSQEAASHAAFAHLLVNETHKLVPYDQAVFWRLKDGSVRLEKISGTAVLDNKSSYAINLRKTLKDQIGGGLVQLRPATPDGVCTANIALKTDKDGQLGGLWLESRKPFQEADAHILEELAASYAHSLALLDLRQRGGIFAAAPKVSKLKKYLLVAGLVLFFFPVRLSVTAPAEIVARDAEIVTVPYDGMIQKIHVVPGAQVKKGDLLATMENSALDAQMEIAGQELKATQTGLARLSRESLATPEKKSDLTAYEGEIEAKRIQYEFAQNMRQRSEIVATRDGTAVFADLHQLEGKPMGTGEKIMMIADQENYDLLVRIPADAMIPLASDDKISFYLNVSPLSGYTASIRSIGYQASVDADGLLTYKVYGIPEDAKDLRIGWKGTASIKSGWATLSYAILRRPLASLRRVTGV